MARKFVEGNTYVFSRKKFLKAVGPTRITLFWDKEINGREVIIVDSQNGLVPSGIVKYQVSPEWCKCIKVGDAI